MTKKRTRKIKVDSGKGLGDTIEKVTTKTGIKKIVEVFTNGKDCGCDERKKKLNKVFSYKLKARCLTEDEYKQWGLFKKDLTLTLDSKQIDYLVNLYADVFGVPVYRPCLNCSPKPFLRMIDNLDKVYDVYKEELNSK